MALAIATPEAPEDHQCCPRETPAAYRLREGPVGVGRLVRGDGFPIPSQGPILLGPDHQSSGEPQSMSLEDVQAVIDSAKARGFDHLESYIRQRAPDMPEPKIRETAEVALEIIESAGPGWRERDVQSSCSRDEIPEIGAGQGCATAIEGGRIRCSFWPKTPGRAN